ncbi:MAG: hypothetical protein RLZ12_721 [Bacillota bacterium]|jgi:cysteine desulfurase
MQVYADHAASTPTAAFIVQEMADIMLKVSGNPSSIHAYGRAARAIVDEARFMAANVLNVGPQEVVFTASGTEATNIGLLGTALALKQQGRHQVLISSIEHNASLNICDFLKYLGLEVVYLPVDASGLVIINEYKKLLSERTALVSVMHVNNEIGTVQPILDLSELAKESGALFHTDMVQSASLPFIELTDSPVDLATFSGHKLNGPKGVGLLYLAQGTPFEPQLFGGGQEQGLRAGTENIAAIWGMAKALEHARAKQAEDYLKLKMLEHRLIVGLTEAQIRFLIHGEQRVPNIINVGFLTAKCKVEELVIKYDLAGIACSSGAACSAGIAGDSHVLNAMKASVQGVRFSFAASNTVAEIDYIVQETKKILA